MVLLNSIYLAEYKAQLPTPVQGTCSWILNHPAYLAWLTAEETKLLWITGEPGCGKTMISAYLTDHLRLDHASSAKPQVFFFFLRRQSQISERRKRYTPSYPVSDRTAAPEAH